MEHKDKTSGGLREATPLGSMPERIKCQITTGIYAPSYISSKEMILSVSFSNFAHSFRSFVPSL